MNATYQSAVLPCSQTRPPGKGRRIPAAGCKYGIRCTSLAKNCFPVTKSDLALLTLTTLTTGARSSNLTVQHSAALTSYTSPVLQLAYTDPPWNAHIREYSLRRFAKTFCRPSAGSLLETAEELKPYCRN